MGYSHYFGNDKTIPQAQWNKLTKDVRKLVKHLNEEETFIVRESDDTNHPPIVTAEQIRFNGVEEAGHETFMINRKGENDDFCKTARKPYDIAVATSLILYSHHVKGVRVNSDGDFEDTEWIDAVKLADSLFGVKPNFELR